MPYQKKFEATLYNPDWLRRVYLDENRNAAQVAELAGCTRGAVLDALRRYGIAVKDASEAQKLAPHPGSHAPRPRAKYRDTLNNKEWMLARAHLNAAEIAREAGCAVPVARRAMRRAGLTTPTLSEAKAGRGIPSLRKDDADLTETSRYRKSRALCPAGPCKICGGPGETVNHIDRNNANNVVENLERLCHPCHRWQHTAEGRVMLELLAELGISYEKIWTEARKRIVEGKFGPVTRTPGSLTVAGVTKSLSGWSKASGLREGTIRRRLAAGWDPTRAVSEEPHETQLIEFEGVRATISDHARHRGLPVGVVFGRLQAGWSLDRALNTPMRS